MFLFDWMANPEAWVAFITLATLELVLGIDNIVFISILAGKLPPEQQKKARRTGLLVAAGSRLLLLFSITWVMKLEGELFTVFEREISGRDLILIIGGLFLLAKATHEIHAKLEGDEGVSKERVAATYGGVITQIALIDLVFSLDSVITAVGMVPAEQIGVMVWAIVIAVAFMMLFANPIGNFVEKHPTVKMLALSFLLLVGMALVAEGVDVHIPKSAIYFAMGFSIFVEILNLKLAKRREKPADLGEPHIDEDQGGATPPAESSSTS